MGIFDSKTKEVETAVPTVQPSAQQTYADPAQELAARQLQDLYFNPQYGMLARPKYPYQCNRLLVFRH